MHLMSKLRAAFPWYLLALVAVAPACASKAKTPPAAAPAPVTEPPPAPAVEEPVQSEPPPPDNSALVTALDALDAALEGCHGQLGTKKANECGAAISAAVAGLNEPIQNSSRAGEFMASQQDIQTMTDSLAKSISAGKHKEEHKQLDGISKQSKEMRSKL
jgi:predicted component of type VI protein secretion system